MRSIAEFGYFGRIVAAGTARADLPRHENIGPNCEFQRFAAAEWLRRFGPFGKILRVAAWSAAVAWQFRNQPVRCVNAHTLSVLPLAAVISWLTGCRLIYEPHELETEVQTAKPYLKPLLRAIERYISRRADHVMTVSPPITDWYRQNYGLDHIDTIRNLPERTEFESLPDAYFANMFGFPETDLVFLYQGLFTHGRGIEQSIEAFRRVPAGRHIVFMGFGVLKDFIEQAAAEIRNVHYHPAVPGSELLRYSAAADVGMLTSEARCLSYRYTYPNKYTEYLQAGTAVMVQKELWLCSEVSAFQIGWCPPLDPAGLADVVANVSRDDIAAAERNIEHWSSQNNWRREKAIMRSIYQRLFAEP